MSAVNSEQRRLLERVVADARDQAETAARAALTRLAVEESAPFETMGPDDRALRNLLRAEARRLGTFDALVTEVAYQHWHRMLFARFLTENELLMFDGTDTNLTLEECEALAKEEADEETAQAGKPVTITVWDVAARHAAKMLPGVFRVQDPALQVRFAINERQPLEKLLRSLPTPVFQADDSLGWVYQFWQAKAKTAVNASGRKIGGADISPVTQLFTEHYMVQFLLHNSLGAWWAGKHEGEELPTELSYLRRNDDGTPSAGVFAGWPQTAKELKILDPSCGSGHFLVAAFALLTRFRMREEGLTERDAGDAVLRDNLFGLELDPRCSQIAAFALALAAWKHGGYRELPVPHVACSGIRLGGDAKDWARLGEKDGKLIAVLAQLRALFAQAPDLGSLIDPSRVGLQAARTGASGRTQTPATATPAQGALYEVATGEREYAGEPLVEIERVLATLSVAAERFGENADDTPIFGDAAGEAVRAVLLLSDRYHLVITNVPYLGRGKQGDSLRKFCTTHYPLSQIDLATVFIERCLHFCTNGGSVALVTPQNWQSQGSYESLRSYLLRQKTWNVVARLGFGAFSTPMYDFNVMMGVWTNASPEADQALAGLDASAKRLDAGKDELLRIAPVKIVSQVGQLQNPDVRISLEDTPTGQLLNNYADVYQGIGTSDNAQFLLNFWEIASVSESWRFVQNAADKTGIVGGSSFILPWEDGTGRYYRHAMALKAVGRLGGWKSGKEAWTKGGLAINVTSQPRVNLYFGTMFDTTVAALIPKNDSWLTAMYCFISSPEYNQLLRGVDQALSVTEHTLAKVPFDLDHWQKVADERYPDGLPEPHSDDPTQWLFHGHPARTAPGPSGDDALQVAVARLLGYRWPRQTGAEIPGCGLLPDDDLSPFADGDGIVCLPPVHGEASASERLRELLVAALSPPSPPSAAPSPPLPPSPAALGEGGVREPSGSVTPPSPSPLILTPPLPAQRERGAGGVRG